MQSEPSHEINDDGGLELTGSPVMPYGRQLLEPIQRPPSPKEEPIEGLIGDRSGRRFWAAYIDAVLDAIASMVVVMSLPHFDPLLKGLSFYAIYLLYFQLSEYYLGTSPGKWWTGLCVRDYQGNRPTFLQIAIRTLWRILEVNPLFFGAFPAILVCLLNDRRTRFGDNMAGTVVIRTEYLQ